MDRLIQSRKGPEQLKAERKAKAAAIIKESASSRVAGYLQTRQGRRPMRVDTLLAKSEKQVKQGCLPKQAEGQTAKDIRGISAAMGATMGLAVSGHPSLFLGMSGHPRLAIAAPIAGTVGGGLLGYEIARQVQKRKKKQASVVPPMVVQLALGILEKTAEKNRKKSFLTRFREAAPELIPFGT